MPPVLPSSLERFVDHVIPILQRRELFRTEYEGARCASTTGSHVPENQNREERVRGAAE